MKTIMMCKEHSGWPVGINRDKKECDVCNSIALRELCGEQHKQLVKIHEHIKGDSTCYLRTQKDKIENLIQRAEELKGE